MHRLISDDYLCDEALTSLSIFGKVEVKLERRWLHSQDELKGLDALNSAALNLHAPVALRQPRFGRCSADP